MEGGVFGGDKGVRGLKQGSDDMRRKVSLSPRPDPVDLHLPYLRIVKEMKYFSFFKMYLNDVFLFVSLCFNVGGICGTWTEVVCSMGCLFFD